MTRLTGPAQTNSVRMVGFERYGLPWSLAKRLPYGGLVTFRVSGAVEAWEDGLHQQDACGGGDRNGDEGSDDPQYRPAAQHRDDSDRRRNLDGLTNDFRDDQVVLE